MNKLKVLNGTVPVCLSSVWDKFKHKVSNMF